MDAIPDVDLSDEDLTAEEEAAVEQAMLAAALAALGAYPGDQDLHEADIARRVVRSLVAASRAGNGELDRVGAQHVSWHVRIFAHRAVATAFWLWSEQHGFDLSEVAVNSVASARLLGFAQGFAAADAAAHAKGMLDDDALWVCILDGAEDLAESLDRDTLRDQCEVSVDSLDEPRR